jgi:hypothetical protein
MPYTPEAVTDLLRAAAKAVEDAGLQRELREVAFGKAFDALAGTTTTTAAAPPSPDADNGTAGAQSDAGGGPSGGTPDETTLLGKIAAKLKVTAEQVESVYEERGGELHLAVPKSKLPDGKRPAMREIALLVTAGRQAAELEEQTATQTIREECVNAGVLAKNHFAEDVGSLGDYISYKTVGRNRELRVIRPGYDEAGKRVRRISGEAVE